MKKLYILFSLLVFGAAAQAQTIPNGGMEAWRINSSGSTNPKIVRAPINWYGADSLIISMGQAFGSLVGISDTVWQQQLFKDSAANAHGGTYSAMLVTKDQDTLGVFPGLMSNAQAHVTFSLTTGLGPITFSGGTATTLRTTSVSAWVKYIPTNNLDSASITVQAYGNVDGNADSMLGYGFMKIGNTPSFIQVTVPVTYANPSLIVDTIRISFASSTDTPFVNSTLWIDDVTATGVAQPIGVADINAHNRFNVYPNPANDNVYIDGPSAVTMNIVSINGAVVSSKEINGKGKVDISALSEGLYLYTLSEHGNVVQRGKLNITR